MDSQEANGKCSQVVAQTCVDSVLLQYPCDVHVHVLLIYFCCAAALLLYSIISHAIKNRDIPCTPYVVVSLDLLFFMGVLRAPAACVCVCV